MIPTFYNQLVLQIVDAIISHGCFLNECNILHSIVGVRSRLETGVELEVSYAYVESAYVESLLCFAIWSLQDT